jgi:HSP20 family protein
MNNILRRAGVDVPEPVRRFLEGDLASWLRVEEYRDAGALVIKAQVPGIDPDTDADITVTGNQLQITVRHEEKHSTRTKRDTAPNSATESSPAPSRCRRLSIRGR